MSKHILIIGASRGIGLGLAQEFAARGWQVVATARSDGGPLAEAIAASGGRIDSRLADVTQDDSIAGLANEFAGQSFDALVVNAGVYGPADQSIDGLTRDSVADILMTNAVGPARTALALLPLLREGGTLGLMTSKMGSIADSSGGSNHYRMSKVAQNMLARSLFEQHAKARGIAVLSLHPGWVQTDMGGPNATITVDQSARGLADCIAEERAPVHTFIGYDGDTIPW